MRRRCSLGLVFALLFQLTAAVVAEDYDLVLRGGRIVDPANGVDQVAGLV